MLQSERVLYPFLSVATKANANANPLCERAIRVDNWKGSGVSSNSSQRSYH